MASLACRPALGERRSPEFAAGKAQVWTAILGGSAHIVEQALSSGDVTTARAWLLVREFRTATRFSRPNADATLAVKGAADGTLDSQKAIQFVHADLLDTYQARMNGALHDLDAAGQNHFDVRQAELAALAWGYFHILAPAYAQQRGPQALAEINRAFSALQNKALTGGPTGAELEAVVSLLENFRAAPLSPADQERRASQLVRYLSLAPVEYGRGVADGRVTRLLEIQEALTFQQAAQAAFDDLRSQLSLLDAGRTAQAAQSLARLGEQLNDASTGAGVPNPADLQASADSVLMTLKAVMPEGWQKGGSSGDFDVIASMLDQMESAVHSGDYPSAESARLEAYAVLESGPEARLAVLDPQRKQQIEDLFWNGQGENKGLAYLLHQNAPSSEIHASRAALDSEMEQVQGLLAQESAPLAVVGNAGIIVFREGLEAVIILASLMGSLKRGEGRKYRLPMWLGAGLALCATAATWMLAHSVLMAMARYGEKLEALVSLIAIAVLLLITNWFFHKSYWNDWIASFHARKKRLFSGETGLLLGLVSLGFTSVYREGFETVLFLQALVLEGNANLVLAGVGVGLAVTFTVGLLTFKLQNRLPYKDMLVATGVLIGGVLLVMVGKTVHVVQLVGWLPTGPIPGVSVPYWLGAWFGVYPTWEGAGLQLAAAALVIGSYFLAEAMRKRRLALHLGATAASEAPPAGPRQANEILAAAPLISDGWEENS